MLFIKTKRIYLKTCKLPENSPNSPAGCRIEHRQNLPAGEYLNLYTRVGADLHWTDRRLMPVLELQALLNRKNCFIYILYCRDELAGYSEWISQADGKAEIAYFGLVPEWRGKGLGKFLLLYTMNKIKTHGINHARLHTCALDHPHALKNYLQRGFEIFKEEEIEQMVK